MVLTAAVAVASAFCFTGSTSPGVQEMLDPEPAGATPVPGGVR